MEADVIVDRRKLRRRLSFWRVVAFVAIAVAAIGVIAMTAGRESLIETHVPQIARVTLSGIITSDRKQIEMLDKIGKSKAVRAVVLSLDSPGGTTAGGEELYYAVRRLAEKKPVVATVDTMAASAAYMVAVATDRIFVRNTSITGSIGVIFQFAEVSKLVDTIGVGVEEIRSGKLKAQPSPFAPASAEAKALLDEIVQKSYDWFVDLVVERRGLSAATIRGAEGRIFTGAQALDAGLVDEIGGELEAVAWLEKEKDVEADLPVKDWEPEPLLEGLTLSRAALGFLADRLGIGGRGVALGAAERIFLDRLMLDGLLSVWQPSSGAEAHNQEGPSR